MPPMRSGRPSPAGTPLDNPPCLVHRGVPGALMPPGARRAPGGRALLESALIFLGPWGAQQGGALRKAAPRVGLPKRSAAPMFGTPQHIDLLRPRGGIAFALQPDMATL